MGGWGLKQMEESVSNSSEGGSALKGRGVVRCWPGATGTEGRSKDRFFHSRDASMYKGEERGSVRRAVKSCQERKSQVLEQVAENGTCRAQVGRLA